MMNSISISQLKIHPAKAIAAANDYPLAVKSRDKITGYLLGKELFEKVVAYLEGFQDEQAVNNTDFTVGRDFEEVAKELNL